MFIQDRINMLIKVFHISQPDKPEQEEERILQAEIFIESLPGKEKHQVENYIDALISQLALEEVFLYQRGFIDGIKVLKYIYKF